MTESYRKSEILAHGSEKRHCCRGIALLLVGWGEHEEAIERLNLMWLDVVLFGLQVLSATQYLTLCNVLCFGPPRHFYKHCTHGRTGLGILLGGSNFWHEPIYIHIRAHYLNLNGYLGKLVLKLHTFR